MPEQDDARRRDESSDESVGQSFPEPVGEFDLAGEAEAAEVVARDLEGLAAERDDYLETLRRVQADFENYRKRVIKEQTALVERANEGLIEKLLPVVDSFEAALTSLPAGDDGGSGEDLEKVRKGIELLYAELLGVLEKSGLTRIEADGKPFDPNVHEAVMQEDGNGEPIVVDTLRTGYTYKGKVLRPAMVKVAR
jgi:molecular chaperone GrpE